MNNHLVCSHSARKETLTSQCQDCHAVVKEAENFRVRELVKKIEFLIEKHCKPTCSRTTSTTHESDDS